MLFKNFIDNHILQYPILYFKDTYEKSEMMVLDQIFFVIGNGFSFKKGYPLADSNTMRIKTYEEKNMDAFFENYHKIWYLDLNLPTKRFITRFYMKVPEIKEYSNDRYLYIMNEKYANQFNESVDKYQGKNPSGELPIIRKFQKLDEMPFIDKVEFYPISMNYSRITQITRHKRQEETDEYALKLLDYAERFYQNNPIREKHICDSEHEIKKIQKLRKDIKGQ